MRLHPRRQRLTAWLIIACIAGMLSAGLAHALSGVHTAAPWQEICSLNGASRIGNDSPTGDGQAAHADHCAFCSKADHAPALLSQVDLIALPRLRELPPTPSVQSQPANAAPRWTHRPRGPPAHLARS